jgi:hypothetical protein
LYDKVSEKVGESTKAHILEIIKELDSLDSKPDKDRGFGGC